MGENLDNNQPRAGAAAHNAADARGPAAAATRWICVLAALLAFVLAGSDALARFSFRVGLYNSTQWTDNVYSSSTEPIADTYSTVAPSVTVEHIGKRLSFYATISPAHQEYEKLDILSRNSLSASVFLIYALSPRTQITFEHSFNYTHDVTTQTASFEDVRTDAGVISQLLTRGVKADQYTHNASLILKHQLDRRTELIFKLRRNTNDFTDNAFDDSSTTTFETDVRHEFDSRSSLSCVLLFSRYRVNDDEVDTRRAQIRATYARRMSRNTTFRLETSLRRTNDMRNLTDQYFLARTYEFYVGVSHRISRYWSLDAKVGYALAERSGDIGPETEKRSLGEQFDIRLERVAPDSTLFFRVWQTMSSSAVAGYDSKSAMASYSRRLDDRLYWDCMLSYANNISSAGEETDTWVFSSGLYWYVSDDADISLRFVRAKQSVDDDAGSVMKRNTVELSVNLRYKIKR